MKKSFLILCLTALCLFLCACGSADQAQTTAQPDSAADTETLPAPVEPDVTYADGAVVVESGVHGPELVHLQLPDGTVIRRFFYTYDPETGALLTVEESDQNQQLVSRSIMEGGMRREEYYDPRGNLLRMDTYHSDNSLSERFLYAYDPSDLLTQRLSYDGFGTLLTGTTYLYTEEGMLSVEESCQYDERGILLQRDVICYGANGMPESNESYNSTGDLISYSLYQYNEAALPVTAEHYDGSGTLLSRDVHSHDQLGRLIRSENYSGDILQSYSVFTFGETGFPEKDESFTRSANGSMIPLDLRLYDELGRDILYIPYDAQGNELYRMETEYTPEGDMKVTMRYPGGEQEEFLNPVG